MYFPFRHGDHFWNIAAIIQENMDLECSFARAIFRPGEYGETEVDDRGINRIERILKGKLLVWIRSERRNMLYFREECVKEFFIYFVRSRIVRISECRPRYGLQAKVVPLVFMER